MASTVDTAIAKIRDQLFRSKSNGLKGVARCFRSADCSGNNKLDAEEFNDALSFCGLFLTKSETSGLFNKFDRDGDGNINYEELIKGIRLPLAGARLEMVERAFAILDKDGSACIDFSDLGSVYDASRHPDVISGKSSAEDVIKVFLNGFETGKTKDGKVTKAEFLGYYEDLGASIPSDEHFIRMMESCWKIGRGDAAAAASNMGKLISQLKKKVIQKTPVGKNERLTLKRAFQNFDKDESGNVCKSEFAQTMEKFGILLTEAQINKIYAENAGEDCRLSYSEFITALDFD